MSTVMHPVGPRPAKVYWVRRLVVLLVLAVVVVVAWNLTAAARGGGDPPAGASADDAGTEQAADVPDEGAEAEAPAQDGGPLACAAADLTVTLATPQRTYGDGAPPTFTFAVTNSGAQPCTVDAGSNNLGVTVTSGADRIWSNLDCAPAEAEPKMLLLDPGASQKYPVEWDRTRSDEACSEGLPAPRPGTYQAVASFLGAQSQAAVFDLG